MKLILVLLVCLFFASLDGFSQDKAVPTDSIPDNIRKWIETTKQAPLPEYYTTLEVKGEYLKTKGQTAIVAKPDTLRAICLVTLFPNGIAHARMGFVVICEGKEVEYLDCRKRALKLPQVGWGWRLIDSNYNIKK